MSNEKYNVEAIERAFIYFGSIENFAKTVGVTCNTVYRWMRGAYAPSKYNCIIIEKVTNGAITASDILDIDWK